MGVDTRKPPLPAPTESSTLQTSGDSVVGTDLATNISRRTDRTSYSIPEDGSPVVISTKKRKEHRDKEKGNLFTRGSHQSQTSLLIEYFEGGKGTTVNSRPSVRVKVRPSAARKIKDTNDHVQITEAGSNRKPSYTRRISLGRRPGDREVIDTGDDKSISSYTSAAEESSLAGRRPPVDIEVMHGGQGSDLSGASNTREPVYSQQPASDISSMPPDSMLEGNAAEKAPHRSGSRSLQRDAATVTRDTLKAPARTRSRSISQERIAHKVIEKLGSKPREVSGRKHRHGSKTRSRSVSSEQILDDRGSSKRRSSKHHYQDELASNAEPSTLDPKRRSGDQISFRSGTSQSSFTNNPRLLQTVEDIVKRLIPELGQIRREQSLRGGNQLEQDRRDSVASNGSRSEITRRVSKHASAPDVAGKPRVVLNQDETHAGIVLSGDSLKGRKGHKYERGLESTSERSFDRGVSEETIVRHDGSSPKHRKDSHRLRDAAAGGVAGGILTAAALKHHDSKSSLDRRERRRKSGKSRSRSVSIAESTEDIFHKHDVPPMPMRSEINESDMTRESILTERTEAPSSPTEERRRTEIREVSRGSPQVLSPASRTPTRTPIALQKGFGTQHKNLSQEDIHVRGRHSSRSLREEERHSQFKKEGAVGLDADELAAEHLHDERDYQNGHLGSHHRDRGLSPIQSVASYKDEEPAYQNSLQHGQNQSYGSLSSLGPGRRKSSGISIDSLSSAQSMRFDRTNRPKGISYERPESVLEQHGLRDSGLTQEDEARRDDGVDSWFDEQHEENNRYRDSIQNERLRNSTIQYKHMTNYTDDSMDAPHLDKVTAAQHVRGIGNNPEYVHTPVAVESAVASLLNPSTLDVSSRSNEHLRESHRADGSYSQSLEDTQNHAYGDTGGSIQELEISGAGSLNKHHFDEKAHDTDLKPHLQHQALDSPRQSIARSLDAQDEQVPMGASGLPIAGDPIPEIGHGLSSEGSEVTTNPSIIQGPIGGHPHENRDHWPYQETPRHSNREFLPDSRASSAHESLKAAAAGMLSTAAGAGVGTSFAERKHEQETNAYDQSKDRPRSVDSGDYDRVNLDSKPVQEMFLGGQHIPAPPMAKDEGYISAANPGGASPEPRSKGLDMLDNDEISVDDPFVDKSHARHLSGFSQGMASPLYDSATGRGIDRIQSKDIVALMDHLTVRDARRNARDTEILVTLVRSAAEMRNSFESMKRFITEQDEKLVVTSSQQHERTAQKIISGPRPQPVGPPRGSRQPLQEEETMEDLPAKRRNVFKRALKGLSMRSTNDLGKIEEMLEHLLDEVEGLKGTYDAQPRGNEAHLDSLKSYENLRGTDNDGYEPEGQAGTSSSAEHSGYFSNPPSRQPSGMRGYDVRRGSQNRVSTVLEGDEELETHEQDVLNHQFENNEQLLTPTQERLLTPTQELNRGGSAPFATPAQVNLPKGAQSNENTPKTGNTEKSRRSSFFPKISRWSKTTASSFGDKRSSTGDNYRGSAARQNRPSTEASRSGSGINIITSEPYTPHPDDQLRSNPSLADPASPGHEIRPPSPLIPSQVSEGPKYQGYRNSMNLQHPQPRQGPTPRYQTHLESQAQNFGSPISPTSDQWGSNPSLARYAPNSPQGRHSGGIPGNLSPIPDQYSETSSISERAGGSMRQPKVRDDGPLVPQQAPKTLVNDPKNGSAGYTQVNGSPRAGSGAVARKPTGPRPIISSGTYSPDKMGNVAAVKQNRYRGSPDHIESSNEDDTF